MIWTHKGMSNWYRNAHGKVVAPTPFRNDDYWHMLRKTDMDDYLFRPAAAPTSSEGAGERVDPAVLRPARKEVA
ncbi:hypothetical protein D3C72_2553150 [compost metagenome]